jgi:hypothetical protein
MAFTPICPASAASEESHRARPADKEQWVIWNGSLGILALVTIGRVEAGEGGRRAHLDPPFDMVGPFSLDELETRGRIAFAACVVMSRRRWQDDQIELRRQAHAKRRRAQERPHETPFSERQHRETLNLPIEGALEASQIKAAYRRLAQKAHPDAGGSNDLFCRITEARNALLERTS